MKLSRTVKEDIMGIVLFSLDNNQPDSIIKVDNETYKDFMGYLLEDERYEDCKTLTDNQKLFVTDEKILKLSVLG